MKLQLLSDLHLEAHPHFAPQPAPGVELLVLAGDIGSYQTGSLLTDADFGLARFSPLVPAQGGAGWPTPVLFVPGNHEYDGQDFDAAHARLQAVCQRLGILWLEREVRVLAGVRFVGTTLWSDFDAIARHQGSARPEQQLAQREKAFRAANYYLRKAGTTRAGAPFLAPELRAQGLLCQQWLRAQLALPFAGPTVVVTHFAPSLLSADPRYGLVPGTAGFCNALDELLPQAQLWLHGHVHTPIDHQGPGWRLCANPLGYARKGEQAGFAPQQCLSV